MSGDAETSGGAWTVAAEQAGQTVAAVLRERMPGLSWSKARELVQSGRVRVDGRPATDPAQRLRGGERVETGAGGEARRDPELLVHLDADVAVVRKPAGLMTVPFERTDRDTLLSRARVAIRRLEASRGVPHNPGLRAVQRLDKDTSGLVVFARTIPAQRHLQQQFTEHTALRRYLAVVHGKARDATYDTVLVPDRGDGLRGSIRRAAVHPSPARGRGAGGEGLPPEARQAVTHVLVEKRLRGATLVSCRLETGRTHQIRIHLSEAGHPLLGETVYVRDYAGPWLPAPRLMLHATELGFVHPRAGKEVRFVEPPPEDFARVVEGLQLSTTAVVEER